MFVLLGCSGTEPEDTAIEEVVAIWPAGEQEVYALEGDIIWSVDFGSAGEAAGKTDCSYTRRYRAVEDRTRPWTCRSCAVDLRAEVEMVEGLDTCYAQVTESAPAATEWIGWGGSSWYRSTRINRALGASAAGRPRDGDLAIEAEIFSESHDGYPLRFDVEGLLAGGVEIADLLDGLGPPAEYACGWPQHVAEVYDGSTRLRTGSTVPDAYLLDGCGEGVRLHHLTGVDYVVIAWVAEGEAESEAWLDALEEQLPSMPASTQAVAIASLDTDARHDPVTAEDLARIGEGRSVPVLSHRGYGDLVMANGEEFVWPVVAVVAPNRRVLTIDREGFSGWEAVATAIEDDLTAL